MIQAYIMCVVTDRERGHMVRQQSPEGQCQQPGVTTSLSDQT